MYIFNKFEENIEILAKNKSLINTITFFPNIGKFVSFLFSIALVIIACSIAVNAGVAHQLIANENIAERIKDFFNLDAEFNLPTVFSFFILNIASLMLFVIYKVHKANGEKMAYLWGILALGFFLIGIDEITVIHEKIALIVGKVIGVESSARFYLWVLPYSLPIAYLAYLYFPFLKNLPFTHRRNFIIAGGMFVGGSFFTEILGAWHQAYYGHDFIHSLIFTLEEGLEIMGVIFFIKSLLLYWEKEMADLRINIHSSQVSTSKQIKKKHPTPVSLLVTQKGIVTVNKKRTPPTASRY